MFGEIPGYFKWYQTSTHVNNSNKIMALVRPYTVYITSNIISLANTMRFYTKRKWILKKIFQSYI